MALSLNGVPAPDLLRVGVTLINPRNHRHRMLAQAIVDTGSPISLIPESTFKALDLELLGWWTVAELDEAGKEGPNETRKVAKLKLRTWDDDDSNVVRLREVSNAPIECNVNALVVGQWSRLLVLLHTEGHRLSNDPSEFDFANKIILGMDFVRKFDLTLRHTKHASPVRFTRRMSF